jgi:CRISPR-associated protein Cas1
MLHYAYGILESQVRINIEVEGYDQTIMHKKSGGSSTLIFDLIEPEMSATDRKVLEFVKGHVFDPADFVIRSDAVCRLNPEMARRIVALVVR